MTDPVMLLSQVHGEGRVTFRALRAAGFFTLEGVAEASVHHLSDRAHLSVQTARRLKSGAEEMIDRGIGGSPTPSDPPAGARARSTRAPGANERGERAAAGGDPPSPWPGEGVSLDEAALLWQGSDPFPEPAPPRHAEIAAAAVMAAELVRAPAPRKSIASRAEGTFWSFG
ncbi:MAG TPA: helix-hairpin-helix domain-containing protein [Candidatus Polarisedimenticolia bacterium]|jgi:hypothetical protein